MRFDKIPQNTFKQLVMGACVVLNKFNPVSPDVQEQDRMGATSGGISFTATPSYKDFGEDIDNCPKNMKEMKKIERWDATASGTFTAISKETAASIIAACDVSENKLTPRNNLKPEDFKDIWIVGDYSDENGATNGGMIAIHLMNALSTGGLSIQTTDREKGKFAFTYTAHYSMDAQDTVPFELYLKEGTPEVIL